MTDNGAYIEVDPAVLAHSENEDYASSGYDTSTQSLTSSINEYIFENGRRYHSYFGPDKNLLPTDEKEKDRLDMHHELMLQHLNGELHKVPLVKPHRILDVGTGTGIWAIDMADKHPEAEVIGTDLSPLQPSWVPPNCKFEVDDAEQEWTYKPESFDFIHLRNVCQGISDWDKVLSQAFRCTRPGGYIQLAEVGGTMYCDDGTMKDDNGLKIDFELVSKAMKMIGRPFSTDVLMREQLIKAGFVDIHTFKYKQPFGPWPQDKKMKQVGAIALLNLETGIEAYAMAALTRILGMEQEVARKVCDDAWAAAKNKNYHTYNYFYIVYGKKPE